MQLIKYEAARQALAEAHRVDEVKAIHDKAVAVEAYARQAKDTQLIQYATEIKMRAEKRCGELLAKMHQSNQRKSTGRPKTSGASTISDAETKPTLMQMGLTRDQSSAYQRLAAIPDEHFETAVESAKRAVGAVTRAFVLREAHKLAGASEAPAQNGQSEITVKGVGVIRANEAINALSRIPKNDALRDRGFQIVSDWIKANRRPV